MWHTLIPMFPIAAALFLSRLILPNVDQTSPTLSASAELHYVIQSSMLQHNSLFSKGFIPPYRNRYNLVGPSGLNYPNILCLLLLAGDIEANPGPRQPKFPCGECGKAVTWSKRLAVACDDCNTWYHAACLGMSLNCYNAVAQPDASWHCCSCGVPHFSSSLFESFQLDSSMSTSGDDLQNLSLGDTPGPNANPSATSSPIKQAPTSCPKDVLRILILNFSSILSKKELFWNALDECNPDVILGCETWLKPSVSNLEIIPPGWGELYRKDRKDGRGGVIVGVKKCLISRQIDIDADAELVAAEITSNTGKPLIVASIYRPPLNGQQGNDYANSLTSAISQLCAKYPRSPIWIGGDANLPDIDWTADCIVGSNYNQTINSTFLNCCHDNGLEQIIDFPTRQDNLLDILLTNRPSLVGRTDPVPGVSDHEGVLASTLVKARYRRPTKRKIYLWDKSDIPTIQQHMSSFVREFLQNYSIYTPVEEMWLAFKSKCVHILDNVVISKWTSERFSQPWITRTVKSISRQQKRAHKRARQTNSNRDWSRYHCLRTKAQKTCRQAYHDYLDSIISDDGKNQSKRLYSVVKSKRQDSSGVAPLRRGGIMHNDAKVKASILNDQFVSVFSTEPADPPITHLNGKPVPDIHPITFTVTGISKLLRNLISHKASGPDGIPTHLLKITAEESAAVLQLIFQASVAQESVPLDWKKADVVPIFKKGDRANPCNYRPISLTSVCSKIMEHIVHSCIINHLEHHNVLTDQQHGFRKNRSCDTQLILTINDLAKCVDNHGQTDAILLDFSKAFDKVSHSRLLLKLKHYGVQNSILNWITDFLSNRSQRVVLDSQASSNVPVTSGVPQGTVLGPLLFLVYINDLPERVSSTVRMFADDCLLYRNIRSVDDTRTLQSDLDRLQDWESQWLMEFNPSKCEVITLTKKTKPTLCSYILHNTVLTKVNSAKYLGLNISSKLSWNNHVDCITKRATQSLNFIRRNFPTCPSHIREQCYSSLVRPQLEYASPVWDNTIQRNINKIESVQRRAARYVCHDYRWSSSVTSMLQRLNWDSLQQRRARSRVWMLYRIRNGLVAIPPDSLQLVTVPTRGHGNRYVQLHCNTSMFSQTFFPSAIRLWNSLPADVCYLPPDSFKSRLASCNLI